MHPGSPAHDRQLLAWMADLDRLAVQVRRPVPTCEGCRHFVPGKINPGAGMGRCARGLGSFWPMQPHHCREREAVAAPQGRP